MKNKQRGFVAIIAWVGVALMVIGIGAYMYIRHRYNIQEVNPVSVNTSSIIDNNETVASSSTNIEVTSLNKSLTINSTTQTSSTTIVVSTSTALIHVISPYSGQEFDSYADVPIVFSGQLPAGRYTVDLCLIVSEKDNYCYVGNSIIISTSSNYQKNTYQIPIGVTNGTYRIRVTYQDDRCLRDLNISCVLGESGDFKVDSHNELWPKFDLVPSFPSDNVEVVSIYRTDRSNVPFAVDSYLYYGDDFKYLWSLSITGLTETSESGDDPFIKLHGPGVYTLVLCRKSTPQKFCTPNSPDTNSLSLEFPLKGGIY